MKMKKFFCCIGLKKKCQKDQNTNSKWKQLFRRIRNKKIPKNKSVKSGKNIIPIIPTDCLLEIFKYFQDDLKTLHSCLLVNKHWCISTVRLIWKQPFLNKTSPNIIDVYLSCLTKHEKKNLNKNGVNLLDRSNLATFDYANFLRHLNMGNFYSAVDTWTKENKIIGKRSTDLICRALCRLFMERCENIQKLCINWNFIGKWKRYPNFLYHRNASKFLRELSEVSIHKINTRDIFLDVSKHSKNLTKLEILDNCFENLSEHKHESIYTLIENQKFLQHCKLFAYGSCPVIPMKALNFQKHSLVHFELIYAKFISEDSKNAFIALSNCRNLKTLIIEHCYFINQEVLLPLIGAHFPHLSKIRFKNLQSNVVEVFIDLIKNNSCSLRELHYSDDISRRFTHPILEAIVTYSTTSLISLTIPFRNSQTSHLITLLSFSTQLQSLKLIGPYGQERDFVEFLPRFARLLPNSLQHLSLDLNWVIINTLQQFLSNLKAPLKTLYVTGWARGIRDNHVVLIEQYLRDYPELDRFSFLRDID